MIIGNMVGGKPIPKTYILQMPDGSEINAVLTEQKVMFNATSNDIREGKIAATEAGVTIGKKVIPSYHTTEKYRYIPIGSEFVIPLPDMNRYDYTKLQVIICAFNNSVDESVVSEKVAILDKVYNVGSSEELSNVIKDEETKSINLGIINNSDHPCVIRCFTYKEIE